MEYDSRFAILFRRHVSKRGIFTANVLVRDIQEIDWRNLSIAQDVAMPKKAKRNLELATQLTENGLTSEIKDAKESVLLIF